LADFRLFGWQLQGIGAEPPVMNSRERAWRRIVETTCSWIDRARHRTGMWP
jgi:hypothetical protein